MLNQAASLDLMFQAPGDPTRRVMAERLSRGPASVSELAEPLTMSLSAGVQHLQVREASGRLDGYADVAGCLRGTNAGLDKLEAEMGRATAVA